MFLFRMHSVGSVRPVPRASAIVNTTHWWNRGQTEQVQVQVQDKELTQDKELEQSQEQSQGQGQEQSQGQGQDQGQDLQQKLDQEVPKDLGEEVVVIQEEEMVLVRREPQTHPQTQDTTTQEEPARTGSAPSKPKHKKKQQKRK